MFTLTCIDVKAGFMEGAHEQLEADDGVDDDDKDDQQRDVHQRYNSHQNSVHHNL